MYELRRVMFKAPSVSILVADIVGFTELSSSMSAEMLVVLLNTVFLEFDNLCAHGEVEKIKTVGDAYVACAGASLTRPCRTARA